MAPLKNVQQQTTTTRLTRACTRALVTLSSYPGSPGPGLCTTPFILRATQRQRCCHDGGVLQYMIHNKHSIACTQNQPWRVGVGCGATRVERAAHSSLPTRCQKKKKDSLTLLPQNHLHHFNNLLLDLWYRNIHDLPALCTSTRAVA